MSPAPEASERHASEDIRSLIRAPGDALVVSELLPDGEGLLIPASSLERRSEKLENFRDTDRRNGLILQAPQDRKRFFEVARGLSIRVAIQSLSTGGNQMRERPHVRIASACAQIVIRESLGRARGIQFHLVHQRVGHSLVERPASRETDLIVEALLEERVVKAVDDRPLCLFFPNNPTIDQLFERADDRGFGSLRQLGQ